MKEDNSTFYACPYCQAIIKGPHNNPALGKNNLQTHVKSKHDDKYDEFMKTNIDEYEVEEDLPEAEDIREQQRQTRQHPPMPKIEIPIEEVPAPAEWMEQFLKSQASIKDKFINFQKNLVGLNGALPQPYDLEVDLKRMDSGVKNETEVFYIRQFYERALEEYLNKVEMDRDNYSQYGQRGGIRVEQRQQPFVYQRGVQIQQRQYEPYPEPRQIIRGGTPQSYVEEELRALKDELRRREEDDRRRRDQENADLKAQVAALSQQIQTGNVGGTSKYEEEIKELRQELQANKEAQLLERIARAERMAQSGPSVDDIKSFMKDYIDQERSKLMVEQNITDLIDRKLERINRGPTQVEVELEKARNELALGTRKLEMEEKKAANWGETFKNVAGTFGEGIGKAMAGKGQPPGQPQQQPEQEPTACPHCNIPLMLPPNARYGVCPNCQGKIEVDEEGVPHKYIEPQRQRPVQSGTTTYIPEQQNITQSPQTETPPPQTTTGDVNPNPPAPGVVTAQQRYKKKHQPETPT